MDRAGFGLVLLCFCVGVPRALGQNYGKTERLKGYTRGALCEPRFLSVRHWSSSLLQVLFPSKPGSFRSGDFAVSHNHSFSQLTRTAINKINQHNYKKVPVIG